MPHFIIECSQNVTEVQSPETLMRTVYDTANTSGLFSTGDIKVRIKTYRDYHIGDNESFIHVFGNIMEGRTNKQKKALSTSIVRALNDLLPNSPIISMNIRDFEAASYCNKSML